MTFSEAYDHVLMMISEGRPREMKTMKFGTARAFGTGTGIMMMEGQVSAVNPPAAAPSPNQPHHSAGISRLLSESRNDVSISLPVIPSSLHTHIARLSTLARLSRDQSYTGRPSRRSRIHSPYATSITLNCPAPWLLEGTSRWWCESGLSTRERMPAMQHVLSL